MKTIYSHLVLLAMLMLSVISAKAEVITLEEGIGAAGPAKGATSDYKFTATHEGVLSISTTFSGAYWGSFSVEGQLYTLTSSVFVKEGDVALITITCEEDNTANTISVKISEVEEGMNVATAISLAEGTNDIRAMKSGDIPMWYKFNIPAQKRGRLTFTGYPALTAYIGEDLATVLGINNPVDYINTSDEEVTVFIKINSTNSQPLTATLEYLMPFADLSLFNAVEYNVTDGGTLAKGSPITITFPNRQGGDDNDNVYVSYYIFNVAGASPTGAPVNLGGQTEAVGTLAGVDINYDFTKGRKYQLKLQSIKCGNHYAPSAEESILQGDAVIFTVTAESGIEAISADYNTAPLYNIAGQRIDGSQKGIIISNGRKIVK